MITDAKPLLWATGLVLTFSVGLGAVATIADDRITTDAFGAFLLGSGLLWVNLALGAGLVEALSSSLARGGAAGLPALALITKTALLFAAFFALGSSFGMEPVVLGAITTLLSFGLAVVAVPLFAPTVMETA